MENKKIVIIGAGPAGLTAAYTLLKETACKPVILEETEEIGGISRTARYNGNRMDIGGHRFFSKSSEVCKLWLDLMPLQGAPAMDDALLGKDKPLSLGGPSPEDSDGVMLVRERVSRIFFLRKFFDYPISLKFQTFANMGLVRTIKSGFGYIFSAIKKRPENSLEDFYINRFGKPLYEMFFKGYTEKVWGVAPSSIAPDWGSQRVKGLSLTKALLSVFTPKSKMETSLIEQFWYPKLGPGQLWETMAERIVEMGGEIRKGSCVTELEGTGSEITRVKLSDGSTLDADIVISTMPIKDLIGGMKDAPPEIAEIAENLPYRDFITVGLLLNKLKIKNKTKIKTLSDIIPDCWIYIQERDVKIGRLQIFNNWSPYMVKDAENTVWIGLEYFCGEGDELWRMSDEDFIELAVDELCHIGIIDKEDVLDSVRIKVKKAYPAYFGAYSEFHKVRNYLDGFNNLYCIGRNGQHRYNNMDHSMLTAVEAVRVITKGGDRNDIWEVNTEKEYHETKEQS